MGGSQKRGLIVQESQVRILSLGDWRPSRDKSPLILEPGSCTPTSWFPPEDPAQRGPAPLDSSPLLLPLSGESWFV